MVLIDTNSILPDTFTFTSYNQALFLQIIKDFIPYLVNQIL